MGNWTEGEWLVEGTFVYALNSAGVNRFCLHVMPGYAETCIKVSRRTSDEELIANAHLIAAAPDLYEALELALESSNSTMRHPKGVGKARWQKVAETALTKARGES